MAPLERLYTPFDPGVIRQWLPGRLMQPIRSGPATIEVELE